MSLTEPIVEGAWYLLEDNFMAGQALFVSPRNVGECATFTICGFEYRTNGDACLGSPRKIRQVHLVPTDPAEVVAILRSRSNLHGPGGLLADVYAQVADLVAERLGVK